MNGLPLVAASLLLALVVGGCVGESRARSFEPAPAPAADVGSIGGVVVNDERLPLGNAKVDLVELRETTTTDGGGRFAFLRVVPGTYTLRANAVGHQAAEQRVELSPGDELVVRLELRSIPSPLAYFETDIAELHHTCMVYTVLYVSHCTAPYTTLYESLARQGVALSQYGVPPDLAENLYRHNFTVGPDHTGIVSELVWSPNADATRYMWLTLNCGWYDPVSDGCAPPGATPVAPFTGRRGPSPLRAEWVHPQPALLPWVMAKARVTGDISQYAGASIDQRLTLYNTVFYIGPVPTDWSVLSTSQT
jgi:hypothetical protein